MASSAPRPLPRGVVYVKLKKGARHRLAQLMEERDVSHRQLAAIAGWKSHGHVRHLLTGSRNGVSPDSAVRIVEFFGVPVGDLFLTELSSVAQQARQDSPYPSHPQMEVQAS